MFNYNVLEEHKGLVLIGDWAEWTLLNQIVHDIAKSSSLITPEIEEIFLSLAFEARKAADKNRLIIQPVDGYSDEGVRFGVEMAWPYFLVMQKVLRESLAYMEHTKKHQLIAYGLEVVAEEALVEDLGTKIQQQLSNKQSPVFDASSALLNIDELTGKFLSWDAEKRKTGLIKLLASSNAVFNK